jgi:hypothetical protein
MPPRFAYGAGAAALWAASDWATTALTRPAGARLQFLHEASAIQ